MKIAGGEELERIRTPPAGEESFSELRDMSEEKIEARHDRSVKADFRPERAYRVQRYITELNRRSQDGQTEAMLRYTKWITWMTVMVGMATLLNVGVTIILLYLSIV